MLVLRLHSMLTSRMKRRRPRRRGIRPISKATPEYQLREVSPAENLTPSAYYGSLSPLGKMAVDRIRAQKRQGTRPRPSTTAILAGPPPSPDKRAELLDAIAALVDENLTGRSDMCLQFAELLARALRCRGHRARARGGWVNYPRGSGAEFRWKHTWVEVDNITLIDGNADSMAENPAVPADVRPAPYWGPIAEVPNDRSVPFGEGIPPPTREAAHVDVERWWNRLEAWLQALER